MERFYISSQPPPNTSWWIGDWTYAQFHQLAMQQFSRMNGERMARVVDAMNRAGASPLPAKRVPRWASSYRRSA